MFVGRRQNCLRTQQPSTSRILGRRSHTIRTLQISHDLWFLVAYRHNDAALESQPWQTLSGNDANQTSASDSEALDQEASELESNIGEEGAADDGDDDDDDDDNRNQDAGPCETGSRSYTPWSRSETNRLLTLKNERNMEWKDVFKSFPDRRETAVRAHWYNVQRR